jgi:hypothetical protein
MVDVTEPGLHLIERQESQASDQPRSVIAAHNFILRKEDDECDPRQQTRHEAGTIIKDGIYFTDLSPETVTANAKTGGDRKRRLETDDQLDPDATEKPDDDYYDPSSLACLQAEIGATRAAFSVEFCCHACHELEILEGRVEETHAAISRLWPTGGSVPPLESVDCCILAHRYYSNVWSPPPTPYAPVKLMIIAESHASTPSSLVGAPFVDGSEAMQALHLGHLNLVHCLSYGEAWMLPEECLQGLTPSSRRGVERGTRQFWRVLSALGGELDPTDGRDPLEEDTLEAISAAFAHIEGARKNEGIESRLRRLSAKIAIMEALQNRGILLIDVSPVPIYAGGSVEKFINKTTGHEYHSKTNKLPQATYKRVIQTAWTMYAKHLVNHYRPTNVLLFGLGVEAAIGERVIRSEVEKAGGAYLGAVQHPSYNCIQGRYFIPSLRALRRVGHAVTQHYRPTIVRVVLEGEVCSVFVLPHPAFTHTDFS